MKTGKWRGAHGFTLVEIMLTLSLSTILASWAIPAMSDFVQGIKVTAAGNHFMGMLEGVRYRSLVMPYAVTICGTPDGQSCDRNQGRHVVVFHDANVNGVVEAGEQVLVQEAFLDDRDFWLVWRAFQSKHYLRWATGRTDSMNGTFTLCNRRHKDKWLRQIVVNRAGRTRLVLPALAGADVLSQARQHCGW